jgi:hypothetical protein
VNPIDIKIKKSTIKSTLLNKAKSRLVSELDTTIICIKASRLQKPNLHLSPIKKHELEVHKIHEARLIL